jgi:hypothetical protein
MEDDFALFETILKQHGLLTIANEGECVREECKHKVLVDGACVACHIHFPDASNFSTSCVRRRFGPSVDQDLMNRGFSDTVISEAKSYFRETQTHWPTFRGKMRSAVLAAAVYHAFLKIGTHASFVTVARMFSVDKKSASRGFQRVKMSVVETRNQFETARGVAAWIVGAFFSDCPSRAECIVASVEEQFNRFRISPSALRASVAAAVFVLVDSPGNTILASDIAARADASTKKIVLLANAFKKTIKSSVSPRHDSCFAQTILECTRQDPTS